MMGIPAAGTAARTQFRQGQLQGLNQFPSAVAGNLANLQSAKLGNRAHKRTPILVLFIKEWVV